MTACRYIPAQLYLGLTYIRKLRSPLHAIHPYIVDDNINLFLHLYKYVNNIIKHESDRKHKLH